MICPVRMGFGLTPAISANVNTADADPFASFGSVDTSEPPISSGAPQNRRNVDVTNEFPNAPRNNPASSARLTLRSYVSYILGRLTRILEPPAGVEPATY